MKNEFFGSKLNTVLLFVLIILMVIAIRMMLQNKELYLPILGQNQEQKIDTVVFQISGNKDDLVSFSILPNSKVHGVVSYRGVVKGGYFFEGNILINILDINKNSLKKSHADATTDWMTAGPVNFEGNIDFSLLQKGPAYLEIHNDNASGLPENDKSIFIPIIIE
jgi:hypothetical protein